MSWLRAYPTLLKAYYASSIEYRGQLLIWILSSVLPLVMMLVWIQIANTQFLALLICATIILYSLNMLLITSTFWFVRLENVMELLFTFYEAGRFPVSVFPTWLRAILTFVVLIAFITTVPAAVIIERLNAEFVLLAVVVTEILFAACTAYWRFAVRHYSSASS